MILDQVSIYKHLADEKIPLTSGDTNIDEFWFNLAFHSSDSVMLKAATYKISNLAKFFFRLCLIPHANTSSERTFSNNLIKTEKRNRLKCETIQSIIRVKEYVEK